MFKINIPFTDISCREEDENDEEENSGKVNKTVMFAKEKVESKWIVTSNEEIYMFISFFTCNDCGNFFEIVLFFLSRDPVILSECYIVAK